VASSDRITLYKGLISKHLESSEYYNHTVSCLLPVIYSRLFPLVSSRFFTGFYEHYLNNFKALLQMITTLQSLNLARMKLGSSVSAAFHL